MLVDRLAILEVLAADPAPVCLATLALYPILVARSIDARRIMEALRTAVIWVAAERASCLMYHFIAAIAIATPKQVLLVTASVYLNYETLLHLIHLAAALAACLAHVSQRRARI